MAKKRSHESERKRSEASRKGHHKGHRAKLTVIGPHLGGKHDRKRSHRKTARRKRA